MIDECLTVVVCRGLYPIILTVIATRCILGIAQHRVPWTRELKKKLFLSKLLQNLCSHVLT